LKEKIHATKRHFRSCKQQLQAALESRLPSIHQYPLMDVRNYITTKQDSHHEVTKTGHGAKNVDDQFFWKSLSPNSLIFSAVAKTFRVGKQADFDSTHYFSR
jgi:hypothetical protein